MVYSSPSFDITIVLFWRKYKQIPPILIRGIIKCVYIKQFHVYCTIKALAHTLFNKPFLELWTIRATAIGTPTVEDIRRTTAIFQQHQRTGQE